MDPIEAQKRIAEIQNGYGVARDNLPETMRGSLAKDHWDDWLFAYGMEYGYLLAMMDIKNNLNSTESEREIS